MQLVATRAVQVKKHHIVLPPDFDCITYRSMQLVDFLTLHHQSRNCYPLVLLAHLSRRIVVTYLFFETNAINNKIWTILESECGNY